MSRKEARQYFSHFTIHLQTHIYFKRKLGNHHTQPKYYESCFFKFFWNHSKFYNLPYLIRRKSTPWIFNQDSQHPNICWIPDMSSYDSSLHPRYDSNNVRVYMHAKEIEMCNDAWLWLHKTFNAINITDDDDLIVMCVSLSRPDLNKSFWYCMH